jgi:hypothetical protein
MYVFYLLLSRLSQIYTSKFRDHGGGGGEFGQRWPNVDFNKFKQQSWRPGDLEIWPEENI